MILNRTTSTFKYWQRSKFKVTSFRVVAPYGRATLAIKALQQSQRPFQFQFPAVCVAAKESTKSSRRKRSRIMLSLPLPIPTKNTLIPLRPKHSCSRRTRAQTHPFSPLPSPKPLKPLEPTTVARVAVREHVQEEEKEERRDRSALAGVSPEGEPLPSELQDDLMPKHVALIMDGNARWARQRGLPASAGHDAGARSLRELVELCGRWGIRVLTVFAFSYDNWIRPKVRLL